MLRYQVDIDVWAQAESASSTWTDSPGSARTIFYADISRTLSAYTDSTLSTPVPLYDVNGNVLSQPVPITAAAGKQVWIDYGTRAYFLLSDGSSFEVTAPNYPAMRTFSARAAGAVGDGVANDTDAVQDAIDEAQSYPNSAIIFDPGYTYLVEELTALTDITIIAIGATIKLKSGATSGSGYWINAVNADNVEVYGGVWDGNGSGQSGERHWLGAGQVGGEHVRVVGATIKNIRGYGLVATGCNDVTVTDNIFNTISNAAVVNFTAFGATRPKRTTVKGNHFISVSDTPWPFGGTPDVTAPAAINLGRVDQVTITDNEFTSCYGATAVEHCRYAILGNNTLLSCGEGLRVSQADYNNVGDPLEYYVVVDGNTIYGCTSTTAPGIAVRGNSVSITGNIISGGAYFGIDVSSGTSASSGVSFTSKKVHISNNVCEGNTLDGILIANNLATAGAVDDIVISDNILRANVRNGISFSPTGTITGVLVQDNKFIGNAATVAYYGGGVGLVTATFRNNEGYNPVGPAARTPGASPWTYTAGSSPEELHLFGGTVSNVTKGGISLAAATPVRVHLEPRQQMIVTYTVAPTAVADIL